MSKVGIKLSIDVTKIEKARLYKGKKGTYLDCTVFVDLDNKGQYDNNGMITQDVTKEERDRKVKGPILGNCKVFYQDRAQPQVKEYDLDSPPQAQAGGFDDFDTNSDIPF